MYLQFIHNIVHNLFIIRLQFIHFLLKIALQLLKLYAQLHKLQLLHTQYINNTL